MAQITSYSGVEPSALTHLPYMDRALSVPIPEEIEAGEDFFNATSKRFNLNNRSSGFGALPWVGSSTMGVPAEADYMNSTTSSSAGNTIYLDMARNSAGKSSVEIIWRGSSDAVHAGLVFRQGNPVGDDPRPNDYMKAVIAAGQMYIGYRTSEGGFIIRSKAFKPVIGERYKVYLEFEGEDIFLSANGIELEAKAPQFLGEAGYTRMGLVIGKLTDDESPELRHFRAGGAAQP